jgi:hypothetical protein
MASAGGCPSLQGDGERENFHRSARTLPATRRHAGHITCRHDSAGHNLNSRLCRVPANQANKSTLTILDLCAAEEAPSVSVKDVAEAAGVTEGTVRAQLAGFTRLLKNPSYGFMQTSWPFNVMWQQGNYAAYYMDPELVQIWRTIRQPGLRYDDLELIC